MSELSLDYLFHPRSIAIAGVSEESIKFSAGQSYMQSLIDAGFKGNIYPVNPNGGEAFGSRIYPSVNDIPDNVDYVISAIPARYVLQLVTDCVSKGVKTIHLFSSGFSEIEEEEGGQLESEILMKARQGGTRIIGPNCMGLYCPRTGLTFGRDFPRESGPVAVIAQSGGNSTYCIREGSTRGVYFSKVISYGNASDLNETDFLEYLTDDPETKIIALYIEGVKDGSRFAKVLRAATKVKPVIICKVGNTDTGAKVAASHTSAVTGSNRSWEILLKQAGAIQVDSIEEIIDVALLFKNMSPPKGKNTAIIGGGGGSSVQAADSCSNAGLILPMLPAQIRQRFRDICATEAGYIFRNPVDILPFARPDILPNIVKIVADCDQIDLLIIHVPLDSMPLGNARNMITAYVDPIIEIKDAVNKPMAVVLHCEITDIAMQLASESRVRLSEAGFSVYPSIPRAASAISKFIQYHQRHQASSEDD